LKQLYQAIRVRSNTNWAELKKSTENI
jgi:hypothetical protein